MKYEYKIAAQQLSVTVTLNKRKKVRDEVVSINTDDVERYINENIKLPSGMQLDGCKMNKHASNAEEKHRIVTWVFNLKKPSVRKKTKSNA